MSETDKILNDIRSYLRITAAASLRNTAANTLDTQEKALVYSKMDGKTSQPKIESMTGVPQKTISNWANAFVEGGLASPPNEYYPAHGALFSLNELGINISVLKKRGKAERSEKASTTLDVAISHQTEEAK